MAPTWRVCFIFFEILLLMANTRSQKGISQKGVPFTPMLNFQRGSVISPVTVVSSHYDIKRSKRGWQHYRVWWPQTLTLNCPYVVYTDDAAVGREILQIRSALPTVVFYRNLNDSFAMALISQNMTIHQHVPSVELGVIWAEKTELIKLAHQSDYYKSDWYSWVDSGNALYRKIRMVGDAWPNPRALEMLPRDKFMHTATWFPWHVNEIAGTAFMYHKDIVNLFREKMEEGYEWCRINHPKFNYYDCASDQYILTRIKHWYPELFYQIGYGYGDLVRKRQRTRDELYKVRGCL
jgi:hypothetical protein